jgi:hypothetical protein
MDQPGDVVNDMDRNNDTNSREVIGYEEPDEKLHWFNDVDVLRRIYRNDPNIRGLILSFDDIGNDSEEICFDDHENSNDSNFAERVGRAIGNNTHLRKLRIYGSDTNGLHSFFLGLANNRSIEYLSSETRDEIFQYLTPFITKNVNLCYIETSRKGSVKGIPSLISALMECNPNRLQRIELSCLKMKDELAADLINSLNEMSGLYNLFELILWGNRISNKGCVALSELLGNKECRLQNLNLNLNDIDDKCLISLARALLKNSTIKTLSFGGLKCVTPDGWCSFFSVYLSDSECSLQAIDLGYNYFGVKGFDSLGKSIAVNGCLKLKCLVLSNTDCCFESSSWNGLSAALNSSVEMLDLSESYNIDDDGAVAIFSASVKSRSLRSLNLKRTDIQSSGWVKSFQVLFDSELTLEELILDENDIDDIGAALLFEVLGSHKSLIALNMQMSRSITSAGWVACFRLLLHSGFALKKLCLDWNSIDDEGAAILVELLASNKTMNVLTLGANSHISIDGWY